jgi:hypothetical protein
LFGRGFPELLILVVVVALLVFGSPDPDLMERASRLDRHAAGKLAGSLATFALWSLLALTAATLGFALGTGW